MDATMRGNRSAIQCARLVLSAVLEGDIQN
jgi:hypothetical protein